MLTTTLIFDSKTLANWKVEGISEVTVSFEKKGCEGNEIAVTLGKPENPLESRITSQSADLTIHALPEDWQKLENSRITFANGKWIFYERPSKASLRMRVEFFILR